MNRTYWLIDDRNWLKERKQKWKVIKKNLMHTQYFDREDIKLIDEYYLKGVEPGDQDSFSSNMDAKLLLIIKLWLHPTDDIEVWNQIKEDVLADRDFERNIGDSYRLLFFYGGSPDYNGENGLGEGLFLGAEEKLVRYFICKQGEEKTIEAQGKRFGPTVVGGGIFASFLTDTSMWLAHEVSANPYVPYQYLFYLWRKNVVDDPEFLDDYVNDPSDFVKFGRYNLSQARLGVYFRYKKKELILNDEPRRSLAEKVCAFLDSDEAPAKLKELWQEVQSKG